ncbi:MAG: GNAT family N-acetyltransferase [Bdellovibrionales bacterium]
MNYLNKVSNVTVSQVIDLRSRILRPGQPLVNSQYEEDYDPTTFHLGSFNESMKIVTVGTFIQQRHSYFFNSKLSYRLRGMATEIEFQKKGYGKNLIIAAEKILIARSCDLLWFNARLSALDFYKKLGFKIMGEVFELPSIGSHIVMFKNY